jgi:hypothetical protein
MMVRKCTLDLNVLVMKIAKSQHFAVQKANVYQEVFAIMDKNRAMITVTIISNASLVAALDLAAVIFRNVSVLAKLIRIVKQSVALSIIVQQAVYVLVVKLTTTTVMWMENVKVKFVGITNALKKRSSSMLKRGLEYPLYLLLQYAQLCFIIAAFTRRNRLKDIKEEEGVQDRVTRKMITLIMPYLVEIPGLEKILIKKAIKQVKIKKPLAMVHQDLDLRDAHK